MILSPQDKVIDRAEISHHSEREPYLPKGLRARNSQEYCKPQQRVSVVVRYTLFLDEINIFL